ncbi:MAG TPA: hypothetical protein VFA07_04665 [Chthonomonadaceae bacterium]|nr:hypothetical protein [Chthonomonadaceae bacterium]
MPATHPSLMSLPVPLPGAGLSGSGGLAAALDGIQGQANGANIDAAFFASLGKRGSVADWASRIATLVGLVASLGGGGGSGAQPNIERQLNPALYHSPGDFTSTAYLYRATGGNLSSQQQAQMQAMGAVPGIGGLAARPMPAAGLPLWASVLLGGLGMGGGDACASRDTTPPFVPTGGCGAASDWLTPLSLTATDFHDHVKYSGLYFKAATDGRGNITGMSANAYSTPADKPTAAGAAGGVAQYAQAGVGAYGIWQQGAQEGAVGGLLNGALTGAQIGASFGKIAGLPGAAFGAAAGGLIGLLGGLLGHHSQPQPQINRQLNPSLYNAPADFNYYAYLYRATGGGLTSQQKANMQAAIPGLNTNAPFVVAAGQAGYASAPDWMVNSSLYGSPRPRLAPGSSRAMSLHVTIPVNVDGQQVAQTQITRQVLAHEIDASSQGGVPDYRMPV